MIPPAASAAALAGPPFAATAAAAAPAAGSSGSAFPSFVGQLIQQANDSIVHSEHAIEQFASGQVDNVQDLVLSVAQADLSFQMLLEIRNKLIEAYQEVMRMPI